jgi:hypothetical protein
MNRRIWACSLVGGALLLTAGTFRAQEPPPPPGGGPGGPFAERIELMGFEGLNPGKVVKGAPFSATARTETTQTLQDGTTIDRTTSSSLYRDSYGRVRREVTLSGFGWLQTSGKARTLITINDPVAGKHYLLDPEQKIAHVMTPPNGGKRGAGPNGNAQAFEQKMQQRMAKEETSGEFKKQSLGQQTINITPVGSVTVDCTSITRTIPKEQVGSNKDIQIVVERCYSPDLQIVVKSTRTDPRFGTTTYVLTSLQSGEPAASMFNMPPPGYTVKEGGPGPRNHMRRFHGTPPIGAPADALPPPPGF